MTQAVQIDDFLKGRNAGRSAKRLQEREVRDRLRAEVKVMMVSGEWSGAKYLHVAVLFGILFEKVYRVPCSELEGQGRFYAAHAAEDLCEQYFEGNKGALVAYVRWAWEREAEQQRRRPGRLLNWRWVLNPGFTLDDYAAACARRAGP